MIKSTYYQFYRLSTNLKATLILCKYVILGKSQTSSFNKELISGSEIDLFFWIPLEIAIRGFFIIKYIGSYSISITFVHITIWCLVSTFFYYSYRTIASASLTYYFEFEFQRLLNGFICI